MDKGKAESNNIKADLFLNVYLKVHRESGGFIYKM